MSFLTALHPHVTLFPYPPRRPVGTHGLCVRCSTVIRQFVGTHGLCVRCSTARRDIVVFLTWTDALRLDTSERPYSSRPGASVVVQQDVILSCF